MAASATPYLVWHSVISLASLFDWSDMPADDCLPCSMTLKLISNGEQSAVGLGKKQRSARWPRRRFRLRSNGHRLMAPNGKHAGRAGGKIPITQLSNLLGTRKDRANWSQARAWQRAHRQADLVCRVKKLSHRPDGGHTLKGLKTK